MRSRVSKKKLRILRSSVTILRLALVFSCAFGVWLTTPAASAQKSEAVARYETWRGGIAFRNLTSFAAVGTVSVSGLSGPIEVSSEANGHSQKRADLAAFKQEDVLNGDVAWSRTLSGAVAALPATEVADAARENALLYDGVLHGRYGALLTAQPAETLGAVVCDVIRISYLGSPSTYDYLLSASDGRLLAIRTNVAGTKRLTTFDDWRMIHGVRMPFVARVSGDLPSDASSTKYTRVDVNPRFAVALFSAPERVKPTLFAKGLTSSGWLPFEFFDRNRIFIPATVNGHQITVMLDSGASSNVVDLRFAKLLGLKARGAMTGEGAGGDATSAIANGVDLALGALTFKNTNAVAIDLTNVERRLGHPLPMILGGEAFTECVVDIDFLHSRIAFRDPEYFRAPKDATSVALTRTGELRVLSALVEGRPASLLFDIGNGGALSLYPSFWDAPGFLSGRSTSTTLSGGFAGTNVNRLTMIKSLNVGGARLVGVPATLDGGRSAMERSGRLDGNLGLPVYSRFRLIVDEPHDRLWFAPPVDAVRPFEVNHTGLTLQNSLAGANVSYVAPGSPGDTAGLKTADMILTVNGAPVQNAPESGQRVNAWIFGPLGETLTLGLASGQTRLLTLGSYF